MPGSHRADEHDGSRIGRSMLAHWIDYAQTPLAQLQVSPWPDTGGRSGPHGAASSAQSVCLQPSTNVRSNAPESTGTLTGLRLVLIPRHAPCSAESSFASSSLLSMPILLVTR